MKNNNKILYISIAILVLAIGIAFGTYAYYQTTISGTISGNVASWSFTANDQSNTLALDFGALYPGKSGTYNLELSAKNSDLDIYYEFIVHLEYPYIITDHLYFDAAYTKGPNQNGNAYVGMYGTISAGETITIPLYYNWPYAGDDAEYEADGSLITSNITIVARQLTAYTGTIPMNLFDLDLVTYNNSNNYEIKLIDCSSDEFGYGCLSWNKNGYSFESINSTSGYIKVK
ncbi:MAG: hypothetical protein IJB71_03930 [Bacilli bacterium]|nr:hypothetical protein [Bacilli bacterium]